MAAKETLTIEFKASGDKDLIAAFKGIAQAQKQVTKAGEATEKANKKVVAAHTKLSKAATSLTAKLSAQGKTWSDLKIKTETVSQAMRGNQVATEKLRNAYKKSTTQTRILGGALSVVRSKMLIYAFAFGLVKKAMTALHKATSDFQIAQGKLNAVLTSTGGVSGKTRTQLEDMGNAIQSSMGKSNTAIMEMQARLLTFTSIVGKQFDETIKIATDMSAVLGTDLNSATIQIGKALNNPIQGLSALSRVGVSFNEQQKEQIKTMQESGDIVGAQKVILSELRTEFGGASEAIRDQALSTKALTDLQNEFGDALREIGNAAQHLITLLAGIGRVIVFLVQKVFEGVNAYLTWVATFWEMVAAGNFVDAVFQKNIKTYMEFAEVAASVSTQFTEFRTAMGGYTEQVQELAKANENWTDIKQIQEWSNAAAEALSKDTRKEFLDKISEALLNNKNILSMNKSEIDASDKAVEASLSGLEFKLAILRATSEEEKMALNITKDRIKGIVDGDKALEALTEDERILIQAYIEEKAAQDDLIQGKKDKKKEDDDEARRLENLAKSQEKNAESLLKSAAAINFKLTFGREMTEVEKLMFLSTEKVSQAQFDNAKSLDDATAAMKENIKTAKEKKVVDDNVASLKKNWEAQQFLLGTGREMTEVEKLQAITTRKVSDEELKWAKALDEVNRLLKEKTDASKEKQKIDDNEAKLLTQRNLIEAEIAKRQEGSLVGLTELEKARITIKRDLTKAEEDHYRAIDEGNKILADDKAAKSSLESLKMLEEQRSREFNNLTGTQTPKEAKDNAKLSEMDKLKLITTREVTQAEIDLAKEIDWTNEAIARRIEEYEEEQAAMELRAEMIGQSMDMMMEFAQAEMEMHTAVADKKIEEINRVEEQELAALRETWAYKKATDGKKAQLEKEYLDKNEKERERARKTANERLLVAFRAEQALKIANVWMNTSEAVTKALAQTGIFGPAFAPVLWAMGGVQAALIAGQSPPKMRYGGVVGGNRHEQGGTMIEAERGEFVMRREAVDAVGLETMNRINQGETSAPVSISFQGNVLSKDFIEDEAIPQIKEAIRRGADIGVG